MSYLLIFVTTVLIPAIYGFFKGTTQIFNITIDFIKTAWPLLLRWGLFIAIINFSLLVIQFWLYHMYFWWAYVLSYFVTTFTLNIIYWSITWYLLYVIYNFLYWKDV